MEYKAKLKQVLIQNEDENNIRGAAFALSGIIKGLGVKTLNEDTLLNEVNELCFKKKASKPINKIAGLNLYETLS